MIDFLLGVPGKLKTISDYLTTNWTTARAAKVDALDAAVTTRAAAATALTNATWTDARAAKLDAVLQTTAIQSVQRGSFTMPGGGLGSLSYTDITITAVTLAKSFAYSNSADYLSHCTLLNTTTLRVFGTNGGLYSWTVVEFK